jgi:hypothetical protein
MSSALQIMIVKPFISPNKYLQSILECRLEPILTSHLLFSGNEQTIIIYGRNNNIRHQHINNKFYNTYLF